jgi:putative sporulation protein YyaC
VQQNQPGATRIHMDHPLAVLELSRQLERYLLETGKKKHPVVCCIGTDRATGDSLGPLTGWRLQPLVQDLNVKVFGTVEYPVHAANIHETLQALAHLLKEHPLIAIDACLGQFSSVGTIVSHPGPIKPGSAVRKQLPEIGDVGITGIVNVGGFMEMQVLQNTRLHIVLKMSQIIANSIYLVVRKMSAAQIFRDSLF